MDEKTVLQELVKMSYELGKPENDYVILGEGNTSAKIDENTFFVKASGKYLSRTDSDTFVKVDLKKALSIMDSGELTDIEIKDALLASCVDPENKLWPSVETTFHAYLLTLPGINFVGHTHPTAVNSILCSKDAKDVVSGRLFPDEIVVCGVEPVFIEYTDPGMQLARNIRTSCEDYIERNNCNPRAILVQNHGLIAMGQTAHEVEAITAMWCKTARVLAGTYVFGGPRYFSQANVDRIYSRPDEKYRKAQFK